MAEAAAADGHVRLGEDGEELIAHAGHWHSKADTQANASYIFHIIFSVMIIAQVSYLIITYLIYTI